MLAGWELITFCALSLLVETVICSDWLHDMVLYRVSVMFFFDSDVVHFSCTKDVFFLFVAHRVRESVLISAAMAAVTAVWSQPGQVAPVTLHLPWWTKHCVYVIQLCSSMRNLADFNMTRGRVNAYSMTVSPLCSVWASCHCAQSNIRAADTDVQRPGDRHSNPAPFYFHTFPHSHIHLVNWMS